MEVQLSCCLCSGSEKVTVPNPAGWARVDADVEDALCPPHAVIDAFRDAQCPGCVESFGPTCPLFRSFAYSYNRDITDADLTAIEGGRCPRRVNGTLMVRSGGASVESMDLSETAPDDAGLVLAQAIREYVVEYPAAR